MGLLFRILLLGGFWLVLRRHKGPPRRVRRLIQKRFNTG
jgi:hypothetical protein